MGVGFVTKLLLGSKAAARQLFDREPALDRGFDVELLADVRLLADQLPCTAGHLLLSRLSRLPEVDRAPALDCLVRDPRLEAEPGTSSNASTDSSRR